MGMMNADSGEAGLVARARVGDREALTELYHRHAEVVLKVAYHITGSADDAEDVLQDLFVGLPDALRLYDPATGPFDLWVKRLAIRTSFLRNRAERRRVKWQGVGAFLRRRTDQQASTEARLTLERWLGRMPSDWRVVYVLKEVEGHSHADIAELLGITVGASEVRLHRARRFLKERLRGKL